MKRRNVVFSIMLAILMMSSLLLMLCACTGESTSKMESETVISYIKPNSAEDLLDICVNELFFKQDIEAVKNYTPPFESMYAENEYWENMEYLFQVIPYYDVKFDSYAIIETNVLESDNFKIYSFDSPFANYDADTIVSYDIRLYAEDTFYNLYDIEVARKDGVWYFCPQLISICEVCDDIIGFYDDYDTWEDIIT